MSNTLGKPVQGGFSLIEMMVAMTLGLILVAGVASLSQNSTRTYRSASSSGQLLENGRYVMDILSEDLQHAGYFGEYLPAKPTLARLQGWATIATPLNPCTTLPGSSLFINSFWIPLSGYDNPVSSPLPCVGANLGDTSQYSPGTDVIAIRRAETSTMNDMATTDPRLPGNNNSLVAGNTYVQATVNTQSVGTCFSDTLDNCTVVRNITPKNLSGQSATTVFNLQMPDNVTLANIRRYHSHIYYIRPYSSQHGDRIPTLMRAYLGNSGTNPKMLDEPLIEGIENMQIRYGIDDQNDFCNNTATTILVQDGSPDRYVRLPTNLCEWSNVVTVRVRLLARTPEPDMTYIDSKTYTLDEDGPDITPNDHFRRHVFTGVVKIVNISTRRER